MSLIELCERGLIPDPVTRYGIRRLCAQRLRDEGAFDLDQATAASASCWRPTRQFRLRFRRGRQRTAYEVPTRFFQLCLGSRLK